MKLGLLLLLTVLVMVPSLSEGQRVRVCRRARRVASNLINRLRFRPEARAEFVQRGEFNKATSSSGINDAGTYSRLFPFEKLTLLLLFSFTLSSPG